MQNKILKNLRTMSASDLNKEMVNKKIEINKIHGELSTGRVKNVKALKAAKVYLARVNTLLGEIRLKGEVVETKKGENE